MGYPTKVQLIHRSKGPSQWYINFPTALAEAMDFQKGELVQWHVEDKANLVLHREEAPPSPVTVKKNDARLLETLEGLLAQTQLNRVQHAGRLAQHVLAQLACLGSHTITNVLCANGGQFKDWSADYRMYGKQRASPSALFEVVRKGMCALDQEPVVTALDDTRTRKTGRKVHGAAYTRDPLSPPFHVNLIRAQRFVQTSMAVRGAQGEARMVPVDWMHAPAPVKPKMGASEEDLAQYKKLRDKTRLSAVGAQRMQELRTWLDNNDCAQRRLWTVVDGSYTNSTVLKKLPPNTTLVGRINSQAKLYHLPNAQPEHGRKRCYGEPAPTPAALHQDQDHAWQDVEVFFGGQKRILRAKQLGPVRWPRAGGKNDLQLIVLAPTPYRLNKQSKLLYRQPAYLICTDPDACLTDIIQRYLWRWDIEVNFRDEKTLLGLGEAQVRTPNSSQNVTGTAVAAYALLLLAAEQCRRDGTPPQHLPAPKWRKLHPKRTTTATLIQQLRYDLWARSIHFCGFEACKAKNTNPQKHRPLPVKTFANLTERPFVATFGFLP